MKFSFTKSNKIMAFSFCLGDDFNFFVCTNNLITLYDIKTNKQKAKAIKTIPVPQNITYPDTLPVIHYEPLASLVVYIDVKTATVHPFFLNQYKAKKPGKGMKPFMLEMIRE